MSTRLKLFVMVIFLVLCSACDGTEPPGTTIATHDILILTPTLSSKETVRHTQTPSILVSTPTLQQTESAARDILTFDDLLNGFDHNSPVDEVALALPIGASPPAHIFEGRLELHDEDTAGEMIVLWGDPNQEPEVSHLPEFDFEFVQSEGYLIPVQRGLIITDHPYWNYFLEPGRVWQEKTDQGYSRASFPFALVWKGSNATLNGTMTFLFNNERISKIWYQVTQETTVSLSADMWGLLEGSYHPGPVG
ncbi:MAG: hypothetical protein PVG14_19840, partial [Anaerolineales bacterium]